jgi:flotillin
MIASLAQSEAVGAAILIGFGILFIVVTFLLLVAKFTRVGNPSELLVISGRRSSGNLGYRTLIGGRTVVIPIIEKVSMLSLRNMQVGLEVKAQSGGGKMIPITVTGVANVKVSSEPEVRGNAIERFLGQPQQEMEKVARETLEGGLRAVIGKMIPEDIVEDRDKFVATVMNEVNDDFRKLGLVIDSVNIQNVHDDDQYLESIARKASAEVRANARQFEAQRKAEADIKEAEAEALARKARAERDAEAKSAEAAGRQKAESARLAAEKSIAEANNALRIRQAELAREAAAKEAEAQSAAAQAEEARLLATQVKQAHADREAAKANAEGTAATVLEEGKARAAAIECIGVAIQKHPDALKVMLAEMLPGVVQEISKTISNVELSRVTVIDSGNGQAIAGAALGRARMLSESLATLESVLGIDLRALTRTIAENIATTNGANQAAAGPVGMPAPPRTPPK